MINITSNNNIYIKELKLLKEKKYRQEKKLFIIEGIKFIKEALNHKVKINHIALSDEFYIDNQNKKFLDYLNSYKLKQLLIPSKLFKEISDTQTPQGIIATVNFEDEILNLSQFTKTILNRPTHTNNTSPFSIILRKCEYNSDIKNSNNLILILDSIQDPGNLGTIIRTADAAGFCKVILSKGCVDIYNPKVLRSTMGSIFNVNTYVCENLNDVLSTLKDNSVNLIASCPYNGISYFKTNLQSNAAIIIGNESNGVSKEILQLSNILIKIPMIGKSESLNAAIAASLIMYESLRQRLVDI